MVRKTRIPRWVDELNISEADKLKMVKEDRFVAWFWGCACAGILGFVGLGSYYGIKQFSQPNHTTQRMHTTYPVEIAHVVNHIDRSGEEEGYSEVEAYYLDGTLLRKASENSWDKITSVLKSDGIKKPEITLDSILTSKYDSRDQIKCFTLKLPEDYVLK